MTSNWSWNLQGQINLNMHTWRRVSNFTAFCSTTSCLRDSGHFETNALNDSKLTLNITRSYVPHICVTSIHECQISLSFTTTSGFRVTGHLRTVHWMTPKWPCTLQGQRYTTYVLLVSLGPKFWSISLYDERFPWYGTFYDSPLTPMLNAQKRTAKKKKKEEKCRKSKIQTALFR